MPSTVSIFFYLCLKGSCISFRLLNTRGLVLKSRSTVVKYRAWSSGEFRTLKTYLVFVLKGLDSILLNKSYSYSFCFMMFFSPAGTWHEWRWLKHLPCKPSKTKPWGDLLTLPERVWSKFQHQGIYFYYPMNEILPQGNWANLVWHPRGTAFIRRQAHFYLPGQLYPVCCLQGYWHMWRAGIKKLNHQLWNHRPLPTKQAFDKWVFSLLFHI